MGAASWTLSGAMGVPPLHVPLLRGSGGAEREAAIGAEFVTPNQSLILVVK